MVVSELLDVAAAGGPMTPWRLPMC